MISLDQVPGLILCRAGDFRLAFPAQQVVSIEVWSPNSEPEERQTPGARRAHTRAALGLPPSAGKVVVSASGARVVVDALEVFQETLPLLPPPSLLSRGAGGALKGFVSVKEQLFPVFRLGEFFRFLSHGSGELPW